MSGIALGEDDTPSGVMLATKSFCHGEGSAAVLRCPTAYRVLLLRMAGTLIVRDDG
jgi:hypothetical protein